MSPSAEEGGAGEERHGGEGRAGHMSDRAREGLKRRSERARVLIARTLGEPALFAITLSAVVSAIFFSLGVVAGRALGLTPVVFLLAGLFFAVTMATYVEGSSLHVERGGASTFARYAFDEFWSFVAGWAILLDYLIVMAISAVVVSEYLTVFWSELDEGVLPDVLAAAALLVVAMMNIRGLSADRLGSVLRLSLFSIAVLVGVSVIGFAQYWDPGAITSSIDLGVSPPWEDVIFATGIATVAVIGVEAASGLAGEIRVGRRGLRRVVLASIAAAMLLFLCVSIAGLMAAPVVGDRTALGDRFVEAPVLAIVNAYEPGVVLDVARYVVGATAAAMLLAAMNGQMLGLARLAYSLATNRQIPSAVGRLHRRRGTPYVTISIAAAIAFALALPHDVEFLAGLFAYGAMIAFALAHLSVIALRFRESDRPSAFRVPLSIPIRGARVPLPTVFGAVFAISVWISVVALHEGARVIGTAWMAAGMTLYVVYRRSQGKSLTRRFTIPAEALQEGGGAPVRQHPRAGVRRGARRRHRRHRRPASGVGQRGCGGRRRARGALRVRDPDVAPDRRARAGRAGAGGQARARAGQGGGGGVRRRGGGHRDGAGPLGGPGDRLRGAPARGRGDRARRRGAQPLAGRRDPRRARPRARPLRG